MQSLQLGVDEFDHLAAFDVDQVVVVRFGRGLVTRAAIAEIVPVQHARLFEQADRAIDGRDRDARIDLRGAFMQLLDIGVVVAVRQDAGDNLALFGDAQALVGAELFEIDFMGHVQRP